jgi:hypothetical protein
MNPYKYERLILVKHESNGNSSEGIWEKHMDPCKDNNANQ